MTNETILLSIKDADQLYLKACELKGYEPCTLEQFSFLPEYQRKAAFSDHRIKTVIEASKEGRKFDYNNDDEEKHFPWWDMETYGDAEPGSGFRLDRVDCVSTGTYVGARLSTFSAEMTRHIAEVMQEDYRNCKKE